VNLLKGKVSKVLMDFRAIALRKLGELDLKKNWPTEPGEYPGTVRQRSLVDLIFSPDDFGRRLLDELSAPLLSIFETAGNEMLRELNIDDPWKMPWQAAQNALAKRTQSIQGTGDTVRARINTTLNAGVTDGETMSELTDRVRAVFNDLQKFEAERIARTETNIIYNTARQDSMKSVGVMFKAWLSSHGPNVRPTHAAAELMYSVDSPIPIDMPFRVGPDELMFPGDDSLGAGPGNIINCQCIQLAVKKKADGKTFEVVGLGTLTFEDNSAVQCRCHEKEAA
jgi:SPP1 gp7 family putative phage head morphogenesis protein